MICSGINEPAARTLDLHLRNTRGLTLRAWLDPILDVRQVSPAYVGPTLEAGLDIWGVERREVSFGAGEYSEISRHPLAGAMDMDDLARHRWPTTEWFDYSTLPGAVAAARAESDTALIVMNGNPFECSWYMRGFQRMLEDMLINPDLAHAILRRVTDFLAEHFRRMLAAAGGEIDLAFTADDIAGQNGLLVSPELWRRFIMPCHVELNRVIHEFGAKVVYHSDGAVTRAVPWLIEMGIDVLQALQFDAADMDPASLKRDFGDRLCFEGGVSVQKTLPFGTADHVRAEVCHLISTLGESGGYILGPSHVIQAGTPPENIVAMFDAALSYYPFAGSPSAE